MFDNCCVATGTAPHNGISEESIRELIEEAQKTYGLFKAPATTAVEAQRRADIIKDHLNAFEVSKQEVKKVHLVPFKITRVIFSPPATIVFWGDGTKTIVKCMDGDTFNPEVGVAMATIKKHLGKDYGKYRNCVRKLIKESGYKEPEVEPKVEPEKDEFIPFGYIMTNYEKFTRVFGVTPCQVNLGDPFGGWWRDEYKEPKK